MIQIKDNPVGIDVVINDIQKYLFEGLKWSNWNAYHRAYKNAKGDGGIIPEIYTGENDQRSGEYKEVFMDDTLTASSFFYTDDTISAVEFNKYNTNLHVIFQVDLNALNDNNTRNDEEIHRDVILAINKSVYVQNVSSLVTNLPSVYSDFTTTLIDWDDMQPFHVFRVDIAVSYDLDCCDNCRYQSPITGNDYVLI